MKHRSLILLFCVLSVFARAEFKYAMVGVNGLTCSACSRSVELSIRKIPFVKDVEMNLENTEGKILFKEGVEVDIERIARAVKEAGFSVRYLSAVYNFSKKSISSSTCVEAENVSFQIVNTLPKELSGDVNLVFLGQYFQSRKEYAKVKSSLLAQCPQKNKLYFVKIS